MILELLPKMKKTNKQTSINHNKKKKKIYKKNPDSNHILAILCLSVIAVCFL